MKIVYLHQYFNTPSMWGSHRSYEMARRLVSMGHQVQIVTAYLKDDKRNLLTLRLMELKYIGSLYLILTICLLIKNMVIY